MMYVEVYRWLTETSGLGLAEQTAQLMNPKAASKEEDIAECLEAWDQICNRLARYGDEYVLAGISKKGSLQHILVGQAKVNFELWEADKMSFEELLKRVKDQARSKKLERDVQRG